MLPSKTLDCRNPQITRHLLFGRTLPSIYAQSVSPTQAIEIRGFRLTPPFPLAYDGSRDCATLNELSSRFMRFLIWLVVLCWAVAMLRRALAWMLRGFLSSPTRSQSAPDNQRTVRSSRRLVRDPVCGVHITEDRAIPLRVRGEVVHFCSVACRDQYAGNEQKFAANG